MNNKPYIIVIVVSVILFLAFLTNCAANWIELQPADQKFKVVDTYEQCDVVQYTPTNSAKYSYFLHCPK